MSAVFDFKNINKRLRKKRPMPAGWTDIKDRAEMLLVKTPQEKLWVIDPRQPLPAGHIYCDENLHPVETPICLGQFE